MVGPRSSGGPKSIIFLIESVLEWSCEVWSISTYLLFKKSERRQLTVRLRNCAVWTISTYFLFKKRERGQLTARLRNCEVWTISTYLLFKKSGGGQLTSCLSSCEVWSSHAHLLFTYLLKVELGNFSAISKRIRNSRDSNKR